MVSEHKQAKALKRRKKIKNKINKKRNNTKLPKGWKRKRRSKLSRPK